MGGALAHLPGAAWMRGVPWAYPLVETVHIIAIACLVGSIVLADLRVLGVSPLLPAGALLRHAVPVAIVAFLVAAASGSLLFVAHAADLIGNRAFAAKLVLIGLAGVNAAAFHGGDWGHVSAWEVGRRAPPMARLIAAASIALWVGVIFCGRWIAYA
jgi:hypothetical protein